jgi:hypothetical protein
MVQDLVKTSSRLGIIEIRTFLMVLTEDGIETQHINAVGGSKYITVRLVSWSNTPVGRIWCSQLKTSELSWSDEVP